MDINSFISGFTEGEGCFCVSFSRRAKLNTSIEVRPSFAISQNKRNLKLLKQIQKVFNCGSIRFSRKDQNYKYEVRAINDLIKKVIPFFEKHPLMGVKADDFQKFKIICDLIYKNQHRNYEKLKEIIELAYQINQSGKRKYQLKELLKHMTR